MRCQAGDTVSLFNEREGEWACVIATEGKKAFWAEPKTQTRAPAGDGVAAHGFIASLKPARLEWACEKGTELGLTHIHIVLCERSQNRHPNLKKLQAQCIEATEQCQRLCPPRLHLYGSLQEALDATPKEHFQGVFGDERPVPTPAFSPLSEPCSQGVLVGPEGGFSPKEFSLLSSRQGWQGVHFPQAILRAETAFVVLTTLLMGYGTVSHKAFPGGFY